jgi:hypothetical protein
MASEKGLHALLVGVDAYLPQEVPNAPAYPSLGGCVHDVTALAALLQRTEQLASLRRLTASAQVESEQPREAAADRPTYANLTAALEQLVGVAGPGQQILIHYSGHGGRADTRSAEKERQGIALDECLVPYDIGLSSSVPYLRDWELAWYVQRMTRRGAFVTLLLDCCHSGGLTRAALSDEKLRARGGEKADHSTRPDSLLASSTPVTPAAPISEGRAWRPLTENFVLLAACRLHEKAMEDAFDGVQASGAMTHWLLDTLNSQGGRELSYREMHQRLLGRIHCRFPSQTPVLEGQGERRFLGLERLPVLNGVAVRRGETDEGGVLLGTGALHAVGKGARFVVYSGGLRHEAELEAGRRATLEITAVGATESAARVVESFDGEPITVADRAVLLDPGTMTLRRAVQTVPERPEDCATAAQRRVLESLAAALAANTEGFLTPEVAGEGAEGFEVQVDGAGVLALCAAGGERLPDVPRPASVEEALAWLTHLAKFRNVQGLENRSYRSPLNGKVRLETRRIPKGWEGEHPQALPLWGEEGSGEFRVGDELYLRVHNASGFPLNVAVLDLQPGWSIEQVYPPPGAGSFETVEPGGATDVYIVLSLPGSFDRPVDLFKVVVATDPLDVRSLELPPLGQPHRTFRGRAAANPNSLQGLLDAMAVEAPVTRHGSTAIQEDSWTVEAVAVTLQP